MTPNEYQAEAFRTLKPLGKLEQYAHLHTGLAAEAGEVSALLQKKMVGKIITKEHYLGELGDLMWFIATLAGLVGYSLEEVMEHNIAKLRERHGGCFNDRHYA